jgi:hypothetical protein
MPKTLSSAVAIALTVALFYPYIRSIFAGVTKPHTISWVIWGIGTSTVFAAQLVDGAGIGAWPIGLSALITCYVALISWTRKSDLTITLTDWACLVAAVIAVPIWFATSSPIWAVLILTAIDVIGFGPTVRKVTSKPFEEPLWFYLLGATRNTFVIAALERYSPTTVVFPLVVGLACLLLALYIAVRRKVVSEQDINRVAQQSHAASRDG